MTTKEFVTRSNFYSVLDDAAIIFSDSNVLFCYKIDVYFIDGSHKTYFNNSFILHFEDIKAVDSLHIVRFCRSDFDIQYRYFLGFYNRLSALQKESLIRSQKCGFLIDLISK